MPISASNLGVNGMRTSTEPTHRLCDYLIDSVHDRPISAADRRPRITNRR